MLGDLVASLLLSDDRVFPTVDILMRLLWSLRRCAAFYCRKQPPQPVVAVPPVTTNSLFWGGLTVTCLGAATIAYSTHRPGIG